MLTALVHTANPKVPPPLFPHMCIYMAHTCALQRDHFHKYEVMFFQNSRRMKPLDSRRLASQAVCLNVCYGSFDPSSMKRKQLALYWESNRRAEGLFRRAIEMDSGCNHPSVRSCAKVFRALYKVKRELLLTKPKSFPIGPKGSKVPFIISIFKCSDPDSTELDRREKILCYAVEKGWNGGHLSNEKRHEEEVAQLKKEGEVPGDDEKKRRLSKMLQSAGNKAIITNNLKVSKQYSQAELASRTRKQYSQAVLASSTHSHQLLARIAVCGAG